MLFRCVAEPRPSGIPNAEALSVSAKERVTEAAIETQMNNNLNYAHNITNTYQMKSMYTLYIIIHIRNIECGAQIQLRVEYYLTDCWISQSSIYTNQMENLILSM